MAMLTWLAGELRFAGCDVVELPGWHTRGQTDGPYTPRAVMWHHDASPAGDSPYVPAMMADLRNNGAQCWVDRTGRWHIIAAGRMWHAGAGTGWGRIPAGQGNTYSIGVETDHTTGEPWPAAQLASLRWGTRALLSRLGASPGDALCGHKEYAPGRKVDPDLDMDTERRLVAAPPASEYPPTGKGDDMVITNTPESGPSRCGLLSGSTFLDISGDPVARDSAQAAINRGAVAEIRVSDTTWYRLSPADVTSYGA